MNSSSILSPRGCSLYLLRWPRPLSPIDGFLLLPTVISMGSHPQQRPELKLLLEPVPLWAWGVSITCVMCYSRPLPVTFDVIALSSTSFSYIFFHSKRLGLQCYRFPSSVPLLFFRKAHLSLQQFDLLFRLLAFFFSLW